MLRDPGFREQLLQSEQQVFDLLVGRRRLSRVARVWDLGGTNQNLLIPRQNEDGTSVRRLGVEGDTGRTGKSWQNDVRPAHAPEHWLAGAHRGPLAHSIRPWTGAVKDPPRFYSLVFSRDPVSQQHAARPSVRHIDGQHFTMIADNRSRCDRFGEPLRDQALRELALRVFIVEDGPAVAGVQRTLNALQLHL